MRPEGLLAWQWSIYPSVHRDRRNLVVHLLTMPIFAAGLLAVPVGLVARAWMTAVIGVVSMIAVMIVQGIGHRLEKNPPPEFEGPLDAVRRSFAEQLVTFPRYVLSGEIARAWATKSSG